jgi:hypothetical protein
MVCNQKYFRIALLVFLAGINSLCPANANDSLLVHQLVKRIYYSQLHHESYFPPGMFPSYRMYYYNRGVLKKDDNSFFTGLIVFTLRTLQSYLDSASRQLCDSVFEKATPVFKRFQNPKRKPLYSFWQTKPVKYFPNSGFLSLFKTNALPDDTDCTAICLLALNANKSEVKYVHDYLQAFTNSKRHKVRSTFYPYKKLPVYSTWLSHKVPVDFDACVLLNVLYLVHQYQLKYSTADSASLYFIQKVIEQKQYKSDAAYVSPYYNRPSVILYHLSRLMSTAKIPWLEIYRQQLIEEAKGLYKQSDNLLERTILSTALMRWNVLMPEQENLVTDTEAPVQHFRFVFFVANMASMLPNPINKWLTKSGIARFDYYCPAYNDVLILENLVWRMRMKQNSK